MISGVLAGSRQTAATTAGVVVKLNLAVGVRWWRGKCKISSWSVLVQIALGEGEEKHTLIRSE